MWFGLVLGLVYGELKIQFLVQRNCGKYRTKQYFSLCALLFLAFGMRLLVYFDQAIDAVVHVHLGGRKVRMSEQFFDGIQVCPVI